MLRRALLCLALLLGATAPAPGAAAGPDDPCPVRTEGPWTVIPTPGPPAGAATVFAVDPYVPSRLFASDGRKVWRSADGGCRWSVVFDVASASSTLDLPGTPEVTRVVAVTVPPSPTRNLVYLLLYGHRDATRTNDRPAVVRSLNGGQDWESVNRGLPDGVPPPGTEAAAPDRAEDDRCTDQQGCGLLAGAGDPSALYLFSRPAGPGPAEIDVARPDGSWERRTGPSAAPGAIGGANADPNPGGSNRIAALRTDPLTAEELWALLEDGSLHRSTDGARSWIAVPRPDGTRPALLDLFHAPGRPAALLLLDGSGPRPRRLVSTDGGRSFAVSAAVGLDELPASIVHGPAPAAVVTAGARGAAGYDQTGSRFVDLDPGKVAGPLDSASVSRTAVPVYGFRGRGRLVTFRPDGGAQAGTAPRTPRTAGGNGGGGNALTPSTARLDLAAGASATLTATLTLAGRRLPLDLFFLQDTSASMRSYVAGFDRGVQQLVDGLLAAGIDVAAGLGEFYGLDLRYRRLRDVGPIDDEFRKAVAAVRTHERTGPYNADDQPNLTALHQMATGAGVVRPAEGEPVTPGQQATFRPGAVRVVIHAADEDFAFDPSGPDQATTIAALRRAGVLHAGIHIVRVGEYPRLGEHLEDLSRGTGAVAPTTGLDCDGDGRPDIAPGAPLVCRLRDDRSSVTSLDLATPLTAMLSGVVQEGTATLTAAAPEVGATGLGLVVSERYPGLDLGRSQRLPFSVTVTCPRRPAATEYAVTLVGRVQEAAVADAAVAVRCAAAPVAAAAAAVPPPPGAPIPPATPAAPPALPGAPAPVLSVPSVASASAPAPASVAQVAPASHPAAQAVAAVVPQQAPALAEQDAGDYAFSRLRSSGPRGRWSPEGPPVAALAALILAAGFALRRRTAVAVVPHTPRRSS